MDIGILDFGGNWCGPALGLVLRGHSVRYRPVGGIEAGDPILRRFESGGDPLPPIEQILEADLTILSASFADEVWARDVGIQREDPWSPGDPLFPSVNPKQRTVRDAWLEGVLPRARRLALVDMSDEAEPDPWFLEVGDFRLKRELPLWWEGGGIRSFPFLYHPRLLRVEFEGGLESLRLGEGERAAEDRVFFAGTVRHWRYGGRRLRILEHLRRRHPGLRLEVVEEGFSLRRTWAELQRSRVGLYLPGKGELCFRLHELALFGVPCWAPFEPSIHLPETWRRVLPADLRFLPSPEEMLAFYLREYHPSRAADRLLEALSEDPRSSERPGEETTRVSPSFDLEGGRPRPCAVVSGRRDR